MKDPLLNFQTKADHRTYVNQAFIRPIEWPDIGGDVGDTRECLQWIFWAVILNSTHHNGGAVMAIEDLAGTVIRELHNAIKTHTVVGDPIDVGGRKLIPLTKVSFGFGVGGGAAKKKGDGTGGGSGAGASIEPIGFLEVTDDGTRLIPAHEKKETWEKIITSPQAKKILNSLWNKVSKKAGVDEETAGDEPASKAEAESCCCPEEDSESCCEPKEKKGLSREEMDAILKIDPQE